LWEGAAGGAGRLVHAMFPGSLTASASQSSFARVLSAGPLTQ
jgi:hypothetical protein